MNGRIINIAKSTLLSGGVLSHGSVAGYVNNTARTALRMGLSGFQDGQVHYFSKDARILKRAVIQTVSQAAYGLLRSYPRYIRYWEQVEWDKYLQTKAQSSLANKTGQYCQLIGSESRSGKEEIYRYHRRPHSA